MEEAQLSSEVVPPFTSFPSISRLSRDVIVTEKIDGTNAQVHITDDGRIFAGSRNRWITPEADNFGFAAWVRDNAEELKKLGPGSHFGEWWGQGIQRGYDLTEKRFSLFNVSRWDDPFVRPACCHVVPTLSVWTFDTNVITEVLARLEEYGSQAAPGFMKPEGIVVYHTKSHSLFKKTLDKNDGHKGSL